MDISSSSIHSFNSPLTSQAAIKEALQNPEIQQLLQKIKPGFGQGDANVLAAVLEGPDSGKLLDLISQLAQSSRAQALLMKVYDAQDRNVMGSINAFSDLIKTLNSKGLKVVDLGVVAVVSSKSNGTFLLQDVLKGAEKSKANEVPDKLVSREEAGLRPISSSSLLLSGMDREMNSKQIKFDGEEPLVKEKSEPEQRKNERTILQKFLPPINPGGEKQQAAAASSPIVGGGAYEDMPPRSPTNLNPNPVENLQRPNPEIAKGEKLTKLPVVDMPEAPPESKTMAKRSFADLTHSAYKSMISWGKRVGVLENFSKKHQDYIQYSTSKEWVKTIFAGEDESVFDKLNPFKSKAPFKKDDLEILTRHANLMAKIIANPEHTKDDGTLDPIASRSQKLLNTILEAVEKRNSKLDKQVIAYKLDKAKVGKYDLKAVSDVENSQLSQIDLASTENVRPPITSASSIQKNYADQELAIYQNNSSGYVEEMNNGTLLVVANGSGLDRNASQKASEIALGSVGQLVKKGMEKNPPRNGEELADLMFTSFAIAQEGIAKAVKSEEGKTSCSASLLFSANGKNYLMNMNVGSTRTFVLTPAQEPGNLECRSIAFIDEEENPITNPSDPGGSLGKIVDGRNLMLTLEELPKNAMVLNLNNSVYDSLDPMLMGISPQEAIKEIPNLAKWMSASTSWGNLYAENASVIRNEYISLQVNNLVKEAIAHGKRSMQEITTYITDAVHQKAVAAQQDRGLAPAKLGDAIVVGAMQGDINALVVLP